jgi:hypothetical protein
LRTGNYYIYIENYHKSEVAANSGYYSAAGLVRDIKDADPVSLVYNATTDISLSLCYAGEDPMVPPGKITGHIQDENGQPIAGVSGYCSTGTYWYAEFFTTDDQGNFTMRGLKPDSYTIHIQDSQRYFGGHYRTASPGNLTNAEAGAEIIAVASGSTVNLEPVTLAAGASINVDISEYCTVKIYSISEAGLGAVAKQTYAQSGEIGPLSPGNYVVAFEPDSLPAAWYAEEGGSGKVVASYQDARVITLAAGDTANLLNVQPYLSTGQYGVTITGTVSIPAGIVSDLDAASNPYPALFRRDWNYETGQPVYTKAEGQGLIIEFDYIDSTHYDYKISGIKFEYINKYYVVASCYDGEYTPSAGELGFPLYYRSEEGTSTTDTQYATSMLLTTDQASAGLLIANVNISHADHEPQTLTIKGTVRVADDGFWNGFIEQYAADSDNESIDIGVSFGNGYSGVVLACAHTVALDLESRTLTFSDTELASQGSRLQDLQAGRAIVSAYGIYGEYGTESFVRIDTAINPTFDDCTTDANGNLILDVGELVLGEDPEPPVITTTSLPNSANLSYYYQTLAATGSGTITWSIIDGSLPNGMELSPEGIISGFADVEGVFTFTVGATNEFGTVTQTLSISAFKLPAIITSGVDDAQVGTPYYYVLHASGSYPITWSVVDSSLPAGLILDPSGVIHGTPTTEGYFTFALQASNSAGSSEARSYIFKVWEKPTITTASLPDATSCDVYNQPLEATGSLLISWTLTSGELPPGLKLDSIGIIYGSTVATGTYNFTLTASNFAGSDERSFSITVVESPDITFPNDNLAGLEKDQSVDYVLTATGTPPITWEATVGNLPDGLTLSSAGVLSGTPAVAGTYDFSITATNSAGSDTEAFSVVVINPDSMDGQVVTISTALNPDRKVDINGKSVDNGAQAIIWDTTIGANQRFVLDEAEDYPGYYFIRCLNSNKVLDIYGGKIANGSNIIQWEKKTSNYENQLWAIELQADGSYRIGSKLDTSYVMDIYGKSDKAGNRIILWKSNDGANQRFAIAEITETPGLLHKGTYQIRTFAPGNRSLDVYGGTGAEGGRIILWDAKPFGSNSNQLFELRFLSTGYYYIVTESAYILDVYGGSKAAGAQVIQWQAKTCGSLNQQWAIVPVDAADLSKGYYIYSAQTGLSLDCYGGSGAQGSNVITWDFHGRANQIWSFEQVL